VAHSAARRDTPDAARRRHLGERAVDDAGAALASLSRGADRGHPVGTTRRWGRGEGIDDSAFPAQREVHVRELGRAREAHLPDRLPHRGLAGLHPLLGDVVGERARQQTLLAAFSDRRRVRAGAVGADPVRSEKRLILQHLAEESLGRVEVAAGGRSRARCPGAGSRACS